MAAFFIFHVKILNYCATPQVSSLFKTANTVCNPWAKAVRLKTGRATDVSKPLVHTKTATPQFLLEFYLGLTV